MDRAANRTKNSLSRKNAFNAIMFRMYNTLVSFGSNGKQSGNLSTMDTKKFKMGWMLVTFDLPVTSKSQRREATGFRNFLLDDGYLIRTSQHEYA